MIIVSDKAIIIIDLIIDNAATVAWPSIAYTSVSQPFMVHDPFLKIRTTSDLLPTLYFLRE